MARVLTAVVVVVSGLVLASPVAVADTAVVSGGAEVAIGEQADPLPYAAVGGFLRLALVPTIPEYTSAPRGYVWARGFGVDLTLRRGDIDQASYEAAQVGLRYDIAFSQRRMGLMRISGKGGFFFVGRAGLIKSTAFDGDRRPSVDILPVDTADAGAGDAPVVVESNPVRLLSTAAAGTYVRFGGRVRMITEIGAFVVGGRRTEPLTGIHVRVGLGIDL